MISKSRLRCFIFVYRLVEKTRDNVYATVKLFMSGRTSQPQLVNRFLRVCSSFLQTFGKEIDGWHTTTELFNFSGFSEYVLMTSQFKSGRWLVACARVSGWHITNSMLLSQNYLVSHKRVITGLWYKWSDMVFRIGKHPIEKSWGFG